MFFKFFLGLQATFIIFFNEILSAIKIIIIQIGLIAITRLLLLYNFLIYCILIFVSVVWRYGVGKLNCLFRFVGLTDIGLLFRKNRAHILLLLKTIKK